MKLKFLFSLLVLALLIWPVFAAAPAASTEEPVLHPTGRPIGEARLAGAASPSPISLEQLPLYFIENQGQLDAQVHYYIQGRDKSLYFTPEGLTFVLAGPKTKKPEKRNFETTLTLASHWILKLDFVGANPDVQPVGLDQAGATINYFKGSPQEWLTGLPTYTTLIYPNLWPGIDLIYTGAANQLKYSFIVKPGADPSQIRLAYRGATAVSLNPNGQLAILTPAGVFHDEKPYVYQEINGQQRKVTATYKLVEADNTDTYQYGFELGAYDPSQTLILDPAILIFAGFIGGNGEDSGVGIAVDGAGNLYITGLTRSADGSFPVAVGPDLTYNGNQSDAFVAKIKGDGSSLIYAGYIGGDGEEGGQDIVVDSAGNAYVTGVTASTEASFPVLVGPDLTYNGGSTDAFVAKVKADGTGLVYAGYIGGNGTTNDEYGRGIAVDGAGNAYVTGNTPSNETSFPIKIGPDLTYNGGSNDGFVAKVKADGTGLVYAGYIGGSGGDETVVGIAVDSDGFAYIGGSTDSSETSFPVKVGPDLTYNGNHDAFVAKVKADGSDLVYAGYIGGSGEEQGNGRVALDGAGNLYIAGQTGSTESSFPVTVGPDLTYNGDPHDGFVAKVKADGSGLAYTGYIGGSGWDRALGIAASSSGYAYLIGDTESDQTSFPVAEGPDLTYNGARDAYVAKVDLTGAGLVYAGYIGGGSEEGGGDIALDGSGNVYLTGLTSSSNFPRIGGPDLTHNGSRDIFVAKVDDLDETIPYARVLNESGQPVAGAQVYHNGNLVNGQTNGTGRLNLPELAAGDKLVALYLVHTQPTIRQVQEGWAYRVYKTSLPLTAQGVPQPFIVATPTGPQTLTVRLDQSLILFNLVVSIEWDATDQYMDDIVAAAKSAAQFLYDASDGQMTFGQVTIYDEAQHWSEADVQISAKNITRPYAFIGGLISPDKSHQMRIGRFWNGNNAYTGEWSKPTGYKTIVHEFGHYGLGLYDEYFGYNIIGGELAGQREAFCTSKENRTAATAAVNASIMDYQYTTSELADAGRWTADCRKTAQHQLNRGEADWQTLLRRFGDPAVQNRWRLVNPDQRAGTGQAVSGPNSIPDSLPFPSVSHYNTGISPAPFVFQICQNGLPYSAGSWVALYRGDKAIDEGGTDTKGQIEILGGRNKDKLRVLSSNGALAGETIIPVSGCLELSPVPTSAARANEPAPYLSMWPTTGNGDLDGLRLVMRQTRPSDILNYILTGPDKIGPSGSLIYDPDTKDHRAEVEFVPPALAGHAKLIGSRLGQYFELKVDYRLQRAANISETTLFSSDGNLKLYLEAGSFSSQELHFLIASPWGLPGPLPPGQKVVALYEVNASNSVAVLSKPAVLSLHYPAKSTFKELKIYRWNDNTKIWEPLSSQVEQEHNALITTTSRLGIYALIGIPSGYIYLPIIIK